MDLGACVVIWRRDYLCVENPDILVPPQHIDSQSLGKYGFVVVKLGIFKDARLRKMDPSCKCPYTDSVGKPSLKKTNVTSGASTVLV